MMWNLEGIDSRMTVIINLEQLEKPLKNPVLTIGNFDGVHKGHLALFDKVKERAVAIGGQSAVMTFEPHPIKVMKPGNGPLLITPTPQKLMLLDDAGIDVILCVPFTKEFAAISARDFVQDILVDKIGIKEIVVGYDYSFGHRREGDIELLHQLGSRIGFKVHMVEPVSINHTLVSSTSIRNLVQEGNLAEAKKLLGRDYQIRGTVVKGKNRGGSQLGFPTANLEIVDELTPKVGVYAVKVLIEDQILDGVTNIGYNPTFGDNPFSVETHILDFSGDLLGKTIKINFIERLRDEKTFATVKDLADQIGRDTLQAREIFRKRT
jgi:riboflavin kinase/FMN adenylyltransferase